MKNLLGILVMVTLLFPLVGCSGFFNTVNNNPIAELVVRATTARTLSEHPDWAEKTFLITKEAIKMINTDKNVTVGGLKEFVIAEIEWDGLLPEEQALLVVLIDRSAENLGIKFAEQEVGSSQEKLIPVREFLVWINETAAYRL
jgi:hypothetical protein